jgi:hypothetical protein
MLRTVAPRAPRLLTLHAALLLAGHGAYAKEPSSLAHSPTSRRLTIGQTVQGDLRTGDAVLSGGSLAVDYTFELRAGAVFTAVLRGGASVTTPGSSLDMYVILMFHGAEVTHDDDSAGNLNSRIVYTAQNRGTYVLRVTTFSGGQQGHYTLQTWAGAHPDAT